MMFRTHLAFGLLSALFVMPFISTGNKYIFILVFLLASLLPDIDSPDSKIGRAVPVVSHALEKLFRHRGLFHTIYLAVIFWFLSKYILISPYTTAVFLGYLSHLLIDGLTQEGINFLHPFTNLSISGFVKTGSVTETVVLFLFIVLIAVKLL